MSELINTRKDIAQVLKDAGLTAFPNLPSRITPPVAVVQAGSPYVTHTDKDAFGEFTARWDITVVAPTATSEVATDALDELLEDSIVSLVNSKYAVDVVSKPYALEANGTQYVASDLQITKQVRI